MAEAAAAELSQTASSTGLTPGEVEPTNEAYKDGPSKLLRFQPTPV